jgi:hypothetical protein
MSGDSTIDLMDSFPAGDRATYEGLVKLKLVHGPGRSVLTPDQLVLPADRVWLQPRSFTASSLSLYGGRLVCDVPAAMRADQALTGCWAYSRR